MNPNVMLKFAVKREQRHACLNYAEREQIEQKLTCFRISPREGGKVKARSEMLKRVQHDRLFGLLYRSTANS